MIECRGETDERRAIKQDLREERERERGIMDHDKRPPPRTRARAGAEAGIYARARYGFAQFSVYIRCESGACKRRRRYNASAAGCARERRRTVMDTV